jgi:lipopolysaccharide transport system ATP-binding protein
MSFAASLTMQTPPTDTDLDKDVLIRCRHLGKRFCRDLKRSLWYGVQDIARDFLGIVPPSAPAGENRSSTGDVPMLRPKEFWAVEDVSFEVRRGQCLGLIGRNGAGKTTILKMLGGIIKPDHGAITLRGRVGGLIALGAGFNPLLTGRENIYVNGSILGMSRREIDSKFDQIEAFAEIGEFMDAPVQSYSSGMSVRLGFAVAAVLIKPDILLLDEVLAVGDMGFTMKCLNAVRELAATSAVIFVSHNMQLVSTFCTDIMVLRNGRVHTFTPDIGKGVRAYMDVFDTSSSVSGTGEASVENVRLIRRNQNASDRPGELVEVAHGESVDLTFDVNFQQGKPLPHSVYLQVNDQVTTPVMCFPKVPSGHSSPSPSGTGGVSYRIPLGKVELNSGRYSFVIAVGHVDDNRCLCRLQGAGSFLVHADKVYWGTVVRHLQAAEAN